MKDFLEWLTMHGEKWVNLILSICRLFSWRCKTSGKRHRAIRHHADATETTFNICACEGILESLRATNKTQLKMRAKEGYLTDTGLLYLRTWTSPERDRAARAFRIRFGRCNASWSRFEETHSTLYRSGALGFNEALGETHLRTYTYGQTSKSINH